MTPSTNTPFSSAKSAWALGGVRVVRNHHDRLPVGVQRLQEVEDSSPARSGGRRSARHEQQRGVGDDRAGNAGGALLLAAELPRWWISRSAS